MHWRYIRLNKSSVDTQPLIRITGLHLRCILYCKELFKGELSLQFFIFEIPFQVLARIANATRPTIHLCEIVNEAQLERLLLLLVGTDFNRGDISWGGAWAQYSLTCMLQDILAGLLKLRFCINCELCPQCRRVPEIQSTGEECKFQFHSVARFQNLILTVRMLTLYYCVENHGSTGVQDNMEAISKFLSLLAVHMWPGEWLSPPHMLMLSDTITFDG